MSLRALLVGVRSMHFELFLSTHVVSCDFALTLFFFPFSLSLSLSLSLFQMTGRRGRVVGTENGVPKYEPRAEMSIPLDQINIAEKDRFMRGEKVQHCRRF